MEKLLIFLGAITLIVIIAILLTLPTMWLWNWLMPSLFGLVKINFWKALGINLLSGILFRSYKSTDGK
jgi:hypothetical protein